MFWRKFVCGYYLFRDANSFPRAKLEENCEPRGKTREQLTVCYVGCSLFSVLWYDFEPKTFPFLTK